MRKFIYYILFIKKFIYLLIYPLVMFKGRFFLTLRRNIENYIIFQPSRLRAVRIQRGLLRKITVQRFMTSDRVRIFAWYIPPKNDNPVFLFFHGQAESILSHQDIAQFCLEKGYGLFLLSYRGHYKSGGNPSEKGTFLDAQAAISQLNLLGIDKNRIILWGHSYGSVVATETALKYDVKALILQSPILDFKSAIHNLANFILTKSKLKFFISFFKHKINNLSLISKLDNISKIEKITCPVLLLHAKTDIVAPYTNSELLAKKNKSAKLILSPIGSHWKSHWCFKYIFEFINSLSYNNRVND